MKKRYHHIIDVSFFTTWNDALRATTYNELLDKIDIAKEYTPLPDKTLLYTFNNRGLSIRVPISIFFMLCYLKGNETTDNDERTYYYSKAVTLYEKPVFMCFRNFFKEKYSLMKPFYIKGFKPSYEILYGEEIALEMKENLKQKMSSLPDDTIKKRNAKISLGMQNYFYHQKTN